LYAFDPQGGLERSVEDVVNEVVGYRGASGVNNVCITGGEPLMQLDDFKQLVSQLDTRSLDVEVETNGLSVIPRDCDTFVKHWLCDLKLPGSGVPTPTVEWPQYLELRSEDAIMCIAADTGDLDWLEKQLWSLSRPMLELLRAQIYVHPVWGALDLRQIVSWLLGHGALFQSLGVKVRVGTQLHKHIWPVGQRGV